MIDLSTVSTADLQAEISRREGVKSYALSTEDSAEINVKCNGGGLRTNTFVNFSGPAVITINID
ncbi:BC1881 family protein [Paenibacillus sp. CAA11]|uniref:BC1881 family protein n=1 Tax=Paenibacillus sp. CAA11 TaxID=1532905 RepID=UPI000D347F5B|nr:BC1881 family protein [Paenibacillus sp. CAA11]